MYNFTFFIKRLRFFSIFFLSTMHVILPMEHSQALSTSNGYDDFIIRPIHTYDLLDLSKKTKDAFSFSMIISPIAHDDSVLIGRKDGIVSRFSLTNRLEERLIQHRSVNHIPMFTVAEKKGSLCIISAGNYNDDECSIKRSECLIWYEGCVKTKTFKALQAIASDKEGNMLITADQNNYVSIIDLNTDRELTYQFFSVNKNNKIVDIAFNSDSKTIVIARAGEVGLLGWNGNGIERLGNFKNITDVKNIYFPTPGKIVYITNNKEIKTFNILDALHKPEENINPVVFFETLVHDKMAIDDESCTIALWAKDKKFTDTLRQQIIVRQRNYNNTKEFVLEAPLSSEIHEYTTRGGYLKYSKSHLCQVALRGNNVAALGTDGRLHWWKIIDDISKGKDKNPDIVETLETLPRKKSSPRPLSRRISTDFRNRSKSESPDNKKSGGFMSRSTLSDGSLEHSTVQPPSKKAGSPRHISPKISPRNGTEEKEEKSSVLEDFLGRLHKSNGV